MQKKKEKKRKKEKNHVQKLYIKPNEQIFKNTNLLSCARHETNYISTSHQMQSCCCVSVLNANLNETSHLTKHDDVQNENN